MRKIVFATGNANKVKEIKAQLPDSIELLSLKDIGCEEELPENQDTLEGNAVEKAVYVYERYGVDCFSEDTGLQVDALNGEPGVYSARYAGESKDSNKNMDKVLQGLEGVEDRKARFRTVIAIIEEGVIKQFDGVVEGEILKERSGSEGFGYDPIFKADAFDVSFAEVSIEQKNSVSHRGRAVKKLIEYLNQ